MSGKDKFATWGVLFTFVGIALLFIKGPDALSGTAHTQVVDVAPDYERLCIELDSEYGLHLERTRDPDLLTLRHYADSDGNMDHCDVFRK